MIILKMVIKKHPHIYQMNYRHKKNISNLVDNLNKFCFDSKIINRLDLLSNIEIKTKKDNKNDIEEKKENKKPNDFFIPKQSDNLFWCWYIFNHGFKEFNLLREKHFTIEKNKKINWVQLLRENKASIKQLKYKLSSLENNLVNEKKMNIKTLETICFLNCIDFYIIQNKMLYKNSENNEHCIVLKYYPKTKNYGILLDMVDIKKKINDFETKLFLVKDIEKPLKGISSYKLKDLQDIAEQLNICLLKNEKKKTKKQLYGEIQELLV